MRTKTPINIFFLLFALSVLVIACGDNQDARNDADLEPNSKYGAIAFNIELKNASNKLRSDASAPSASGDICVDYDIKKINATVYDSNQAAIASNNWPCSLHGGDIAGVSVGQGYRVVIEGMVNDNIRWRGEKTDIQVTTGEAVDAGVILVFYIGDDQSPPEILSHSPSSGSNDVPTDTAIELIFNEDVVVATVNLDNIFLAEDNATVGGLVSYDAATRVAMLTPDSALLHGTTYTVSVTEEVEDLAANNLTEYSWQFTTVNQENDQSPPKILSHTPSKDSGNVPTDATIEITFNEDVVANSINADNAYLTEGGVTVGGQVAYNAATRVATLTPGSSLSHGTTYTVFVTAGVEDLAGNNLAEYSWQFTTEVIAVEKLFPITPDNDHFAWQSIQTRFEDEHGNECAGKVTMAMGDQAFCYVASDGEMMCAGRVYKTNWGSSFVKTGQMNVEQIMIRPTFNTSDGNGMCILKDGRMYCMGTNNNSGQYGTGNTDPVENFTLWGTLNNVRRFTTGTGDSYCAWLETGDVVCAGYNYGNTPSSQASANKSVYINTFGELKIDAPGVWRVSQVRASCTFGSAGLTCYGSNYGPVGEIVDGGRVEGPSYDDAHVWLTDSGEVQCSGCAKVEYFNGARVIALAYDAYSDSLCAAYDDGSIWCIGSNKSGKLGTGSDAAVLTETMVAGPGSIRIECN